MLFIDFKNSKQFLRYSRSKLEATMGFLWEAQTSAENLGGHEQQRGEAQN